MRWSPPMPRVAVRRAVAHALDASAVAAQVHRAVGVNRREVPPVGWGSHLHASVLLAVVVRHVHRHRLVAEQPLQETSHDPSLRWSSSSSPSRRSMSRVTVWCWLRSGPSWLRMSLLRTSTASGLTVPPLNGHFYDALMFYKKQPKRALFV